MLVTIPKVRLGKAGRGAGEGLQYGDRVLVRVQVTDPQDRRVTVKPRREARLCPLAVAEMGR